MSFEKLIDKDKGDIEKIFLNILNILGVYVKEKNEEVNIEEFFEKRLKSGIEQKIFNPLHIVILSQVKIYDLEDSNKEISRYYVSLRDFLIKKYFPKDPDFFTSALEEAVSVVIKGDWRGKLKELDKGIIYLLQQKGYDNNN